MPVLLWQKSAYIQLFSAKSNGERSFLHTVGANETFCCGRWREVLAPCFKVKAVDTTGAGDSFCADFLSGMAKGLSFA